MIDLNRHSRTTVIEVDVLVIGAGPVGLASALLAHKVGLSCVTVDKSDGPLKLGRADAMNARTLQLLELLGYGIFEELHAKGLHCSTSSTWKNGEFTSRQNAWWKALRGSEHQHFLMLGQPYLEEILDRNLTAVGRPVERGVTVLEVGLDDGPSARLTWAKLLSKTGIESLVRAKYLIGADGSHSLVRKSFPEHFIFEPIGDDTEMTWAVLDGEVDTTFPRESEIINFQVDTSDVARIPREGKIDRYYVRMDRKVFEVEEAIEKIRRAVAPHPFKFVDLEWNSQFTVRERLASKFSIRQRVFLAGDACHVHSVNGGQGLNTGLSDAFNLIWKINLHAKRAGSENVLKSYENERRPVAKTVIETAGALVRATKYSQQRQLVIGAQRDVTPDEEQLHQLWDHSNYYVGLVKLNSRFITGMGISYADQTAALASSAFISPEYGAPLVGYRGFDFHLTPLTVDSKPTRLYTELDYDGRFDILVFFPSSEIVGATRIISSLMEVIPGPLKPIVRIRIIHSSSPSIPQRPFDTAATGADSLPIVHYVDTPIPDSKIGTVSGRALYADAMGLDEIGAEGKEGLVVILRPDSYVGFAEAVGTTAWSFEGVSGYFAGL
ncbi:FAD binding domain-containing protein [Cantharellus anzutake]|uniref:FAD binding domain-containing protein n=1 Tax=Cantharellus anzutake TaxID=1750568 RepID=UPI001904CE8E|nr:FAD binding domain-containing protein [Cantharellus anzutake]KAF8323621.1 FAD binding domain-containing protein [Cantharellus anzutake]